MAGIAYGLPMGGFKRIVDDGILEFRKKGATDEEIFNFVSSSWGRYFAGEFNVTLTFKANKERKICAARDHACTRITRGNAQ